MSFRNGIEVIIFPDLYSSLDRHKDIDVEPRTRISFRVWFFKARLRDNGIVSQHARSVLENDWIYSILFRSQIANLRHQISHQ